MSKLSDRKLYKITSVFHGGRDMKFFTLKFHLDAYAPQDLP